MVDLDELERLCKDARSSAEGDSIRLTVMAITAKEREALLALRNAAEELIRDARKWREHEALLMRAMDAEYHGPK